LIRNSRRYGDQISAAASAPTSHPPTPTPTPALESMEADGALCGRAWARLREIPRESARRRRGPGYGTTSACLR
jgi:hypothetical protein